MERRDFIKLLLGSMVAPVSFGAKNTRLINSKAKAKSIVFLHLNGGPSQHDLFDFKPELIKRDGQKIENFISEKGQIGGTLLKPIANFKREGNSGNWISDLQPHLTTIIDDLTFIKSLNCTSLIHRSAQLEQFTGNTHPGNPHFATWLNYHLFNQNNYLSTYDLPGFFLFHDPLGNMRSFPDCVKENSIKANRGYLDLSRVDELSSLLSSVTLKSNEEIKSFLKYYKKFEGTDSITAKQIELSLESKTKLLKLVKDEIYDKHTQKTYNVSKQGENILADQLILAKKLVKNDVPYIQINIGNEDDPTSWDHHFQINDLKAMCLKTDYLITNFIKDMKREGLLEETLIVCGGEFGRLPIIDEKGNENNTKGRGHNNMAGTIWMTGAGLKKGYSHGETDEIGLKTVSGHVTYSDIWATILHLMGIDHNSLKHSIGKDQLRFTKDNTKIIKDILS